MALLDSIKANLLACILGLAAVIFACIAIYQNVQIHGFLWIDGLEDKIADCARDRNELRAIASKKNEQAETTKRSIDKAEKGEREAKPIVEKIRNAPIGPNCETPGIEILRNEI